MTSNVGSHVIPESNAIGFSVTQKARGTQEEVSKKLLESLRQTFRPEFLNRVDDIIVFNSLSKQHLEVIIDLQLGRVSKMLAERGVRLEVTEAAKETIMHEGYDANIWSSPDAACNSAPGCRIR